MHPKIGLKVIMMSREGLTVREIAEKLKLRHDEVTDYLIDHGVPVTYNQRQKRRENKITDIRAALDSMRVLGKPLNYKEVKTTMETTKRSTKPLSDEVKAKVLELFSEGFGQPEIAERLGISRSSVYRIIKAAEQQTAEDNISKGFYQGLLDDIDTAIKMLLESVFGSEDIYSSEKTAFAIGGAVRKLQDAYNRLEEAVYENN